jgi:hypothetical protein
MSFWASPNQPVQSMYVLFGERNLTLEPIGVEHKIMGLCAFIMQLTPAIIRPKGSSNKSNVLI